MSGRGNNSSDSQFLKALNIAPWPDADNYKETSMNITAELNSLSPLETYDPADNPVAPFIEFDAEETTPDELYANVDEQVYQDTVRHSLIGNIQEFLTFSSHDELIKLIEKYS